MIGTYELSRVSDTVRRNDWFISLLNSSSISAPETSSILLRPGNLSPEFVVLQQLVLTATYNMPDQVIISDDKFFVYGVGASLLAAYEDYKISLIEYFEILESHQDPDTQKQFRSLQLFLQKN